MKIVFIVVCSFPYGEASSIRALNICRLLADVGHSVHVISDYPSKEAVQCDCCTYEAVSETSSSSFNRMFIANQSLRRLHEYYTENQVDAVLTNARFDRFSRLVSFCKRNNIKLFVENCEWYHHSNFKLGVLDYRYWLNQKMMTYDFKKADGFISISRLLDEHNSSLGIPSVRIPTIMDLSQIPPLYHDKAQHNKIRISYTGSPGKSKEFLLPIISALANNQSFRDAIQFDVYGPNRNQVLINIGNEEDVLRRADESVFIHGRIPQKQINEILSESDFTFFLRPDRLSSNAGFPTKLGESMANGTPVICNETGDIGLYLKDGMNGYIIDNTEDSICKVFDKIIDLNTESYMKLREYARITAEKYFDYRNYKGLIKTIIKE